MSEPYMAVLSDREVDALRRWHEAAYVEMRGRGDIEVIHLGRRLKIPADVFAPTPMSDLLGQAVLDDVREADRVLDMGTGCGINIILAASRSREVIGVDINRSAAGVTVTYRTQRLTR